MHMHRYQHWCKYDVSSMRKQNIPPNISTSNHATSGLTLCSQLLSQLTWKTRIVMHSEPNHRGNFLTIAPYLLSEASSFSYFILNLIPTEKGWLKLLMNFQYGTMNSDSHNLSSPMNLFNTNELSKLHRRNAQILWESKQIITNLHYLSEQGADEIVLLSLF